MKKILPILFIIASSWAIAEPSSNIAWTPDQLKFIKKGSLQKGKELAETCIGCHGEKGISQIDEYPSLAGQLATYTYKQLRDYADGKRTHVMMNSIAAGLSLKDTASLAVWFESLSAPQNRGVKQNLHKAEVLVANGNGKKIIPPCFSCHGSHGQGEKQHIPALAGQQIGYFINTLKAYKTKTRHNDVYSRMRLISEQLSEEDIKQLAKYYHLQKRK